MFFLCKQNRECEVRISDWSLDVCSSDLPVALRAGERFDLVASVDAPPGDGTQVGVSYLALPQDLSAGDILLLDDGVVQLEVERIEGERIITSVINDSVLSDRKGLNRLGGGLSLGALTDRDRELIGVAAGMDVAFISASFCRNAADMEQARAAARKHGRHPPLGPKHQQRQAE